MFLFNNWYVAAWADEVTTRPLARRLLDLPVVLYRTASGRAVALEDRCPHRAVSLSQGMVDGELLRCIYHGMEFDCSGACVKVPGQPGIPDGARVRNYPLVERDALLWIWMGEPCRADPAVIEPWPYHVDPEHWGWKSTTYLIRANYELIHDNLLDLSHLAYVHQRTVGGAAPEIHFAAKVKTEKSERGVVVTRWLLDSPPPPTYAKNVRFKGHVDRWQEVTFRPGFCNIYSGAVDVGQGAFEGNRSGGFQNRNLNAITPESATTTHYFWSGANGYRVGEPGITEAHFDELARTFLEDKEVLEDQQRRLADDPQRPWVNIHGDLAGIYARRIVERLRNEERENGWV
ncbi:MAG TPA: aromatic ring-hydroxylating dioxygenase subunit alpha [Gammaproteobacteria bacterium]